MAEFSYGRILQFVACHTRFSVYDLRRYFDSQMKRLLESITEDSQVADKAKEWAYAAIDRYEEWRGSCPKVGIQGELAQREDGDG